MLISVVFVDQISAISEGCHTRVARQDVQLGTRALRHALPGSPAQAKSKGWRILELKNGGFVINITMIVITMEFLYGIKLNTIIVIYYLLLSME